MYVYVGIKLVTAFHAAFGSKLFWKVSRSSEGYSKVNDNVRADLHKSGYDWCKKVFGKIIGEHTVCELYVRYSILSVNKSYF